MTDSYRLDFARLDDDDQTISAALTIALKGQGVAKPWRRPPGSLASIDPAIQSLIIDILDPENIKTALELAFLYLMSRKAKRVKVLGIEIELQDRDPKAAAEEVVEKSGKKTPKK
ncbi:hypothetical protein [Methylobacterium sp. 1973]|uniref:hypothetical protein n=1 Tax=Methylobacterium sp. 1973 TaxID=3156421 RepID=UPI003395E0B6